MGLFCRFFEKHQPSIASKDFLVLGTVSLKTWKEGLSDKPLRLDQLREYIFDFKKVLKLERDYGGWRPTTDLTNAH